MNIGISVNDFVMVGSFVSICGVIEVFMVMLRIVCISVLNWFVFFSGVLYSVVIRYNSIGFSRNGRGRFSIMNSVVLMVVRVKVRLWCFVRFMLV